ncbi:MAG TPA: glycosyltransferase family 1 protein [Thermomicrobiales bacterium]|jgi:glycosyltransferase involved in cell wall biosynthesis
MSLQIGIDASRVGTGHRTGTEQYSAQLLEALGELDRHNGYSLYVNSRQRPALNLPANFRARLIPFPRLWTHARLSLEMLGHAPDLLFVPAHVVPLAHPRTVVTIHDLGYRAFPEAHPWRSRQYLDWSTRWSAAVARRIIVPSAATARDLHAAYGTPHAKITVVPHGYHPRFRPLPADEIARGLKWLGLTQPYILFVGTLQPRKNLARTLAAFEQLCARGLPHRLVLVGQRGWLDNPLFAAIARPDSPAHGRIDITGYLPDDDLPLVYNGAAALAFPSLYEGFGLPTLEAMACGTPVLTSNTTSLPEVVGAAAITVDPLDTDAIAEGLLRIVSDATSGAELRTRGLAHAQEFSWRRAAEQTLDVLEVVGREG